MMSDNINRLAQAAMLSHAAGTKWHQMALFTKIRIWDDATSFKQSMKNGVLCAKAGKNPIFPGQIMPFSRKAPVPVILAAAGIQSPCCHPHGD